MEQKIRNYCLNNEDLKGADITLLKHGHNNDVFLLNKCDKKYVAHVGRGKRDGGSSLAGSFKSLRYLETKNIDFVPKIIAFNNDADILVETYVGEESIKFQNFNEKLFNIFAKQLAEIHKLDYKDFQKYCENEGFDIPRIKTRLDKIQVFGIDRLNIVKELDVDYTVINWIEPKLEENLVLLKKLVNNETPRLRWGDIGDNTRIEKQKIWMIDWEFSSISYGHELSYIKIHSHPTPEQFKFIVEKYALHSGLDVDDLYDGIYLEEKTIRTNDVIWAAMKWGENKNNSVEARKYKELTYKRIKLYEKFIKAHKTV